MERRNGNRISVRKGVRKGLWKGFCLMLMCVLATLTACGGEKESGSPAEEKWAYMPEFLTLEGEIPFREGKLYGDSLYYLQEEGDIPLWTLYRYPLAKKKDNDDCLTTESIILRRQKEDSVGTVRAFAVAEDGSIYLIESGGILYQFNAEGEEMFEVTLDSSQDSWFLQTDGQGFCYCASGNMVARYDKEGNLTGSLSLESEESRISGLGRGRDGELYAVYNEIQKQGDFIVIGGTSYQLAELDFEARKATEVEADFADYELESLVPGFDGDFLLYDGSGIYDYYLDGQSAEEVLRWLDCDINGSYARLLGVLEDGRIVVACEDYGAQETELVLLTEKKITPDMERQTLTLGTLFPNNAALRTLAVDFNKKNDRYRIEIQGYYDSASGESESDGLMKLQNAILSENSPDLIDLTGLDVKLYAEKGAFADLSPYLEKSGTLKKEDFLENILREYTLGGRLVAIPNRFCVTSVVGSAAELGGDVDWTLEAVIDYAGEHPGMDLFSDVRKSAIMEFLMMFGQDAFWNRSTGECHFDTEEFQKLLAFVNQFPDSAQAQVGSMSGPARIQAGEVLLMTALETRLNSFQLYQEMFPDGAVYIGYPTVDGSGGHRITNVSQIYGISSRSKLPDGAWEFIESVLTREEETSFSTIGFPVVKRQLEKEVRDALLSAYVLDENGEPVLDEDGEPIPNTEVSYAYWSMDWQYTYRAPTREEIDKVLDLIGKARLASGEDDEILAMINEEAEAFYQGQKSAEEVSEVIQSRVSLYLSEMK